MNERLATVLACLREVDDPELGLNVVDLGLVYGVQCEGPRVHVQLSLTSQGCPLQHFIRQTAEQKLRARLPPGTPVVVELLFAPPWQPAMMAPEARRAMGW